MTRRKKNEFKRRREGKTDYKRRASLLKSRIPRLVVRKTNRYIIVQIVKSEEAQDYVLCTANSSELKKMGLSGSLKNSGASYLTGLLVAKKAKEKKIKNAIADFGNYHSTKGGKIYAVLKGVSDGGIEINFDEKMAPPEEKIKKGIKEEQFKKIKENLIK